MAATVRGTEHAGQVLEWAAELLASDPVRHNVILTLLHTRVAHPEPGRYWVVDVDGRTAGVIFQSPLDYGAAVTPMPEEAVSAGVEAIVAQGVRLPGVNGEAATAARFAGHWAECTRSGARPIQAQRLYEVDTVMTTRTAAPGQLRQATIIDSDLLVSWVRAFQAEIRENVSDPMQMVDRRLASGDLWIWEDSEPVAFAGLSEAVSGVVRVGPVYTPLNRRGFGYASAVVAGVSRDVRDRGLRCILYADLENPVSNSIYRGMGYRTVAEALRYEFDAT